MCAGGNVSDYLFFKIQLKSILKEAVAASFSTNVQ